MTRRGSSIFKIVAVSVIVLGGVGYLAFRRSASDAPVVFRTGTLDKGPVEQTVTATGSLSAVVTVQESQTGWRPSTIDEWRDPDPPALVTAGAASASTAWSGSAACRTGR